MDLSDLTIQFVGNGVANNFGLMNRRDLFANQALVSTFLRGSIMRIQRELRVPAMEKWVQVTITAPYTGLVIPSDYIELIGIYPQADYVNRLRRDKLERALNYAQFATDKSMLYSRQGGVWILGPAPSIGDVLMLGYYAEVTPLVNPTDTNILSIIAWDLIVYGALVLACEYYNDKRRDGFEARFTQIKDDLQDMGDDDELDEGHMELCHAFPDDDTDNYEIWVP